MLEYSSQLSADMRLSSADHVKQFHTLFLLVVTANAELEYSVARLAHIER